MSVGRKEPCPCGSGKKYKRCCFPKFGTNEPAAPVAASTDSTAEPSPDAGRATQASGARDKAQNGQRLRDQAPRVRATLRRRAV